MAIPQRRPEKTAQNAPQGMPIDFKMEKTGDYLLVTCNGHYEGTGLRDVHRQALDHAIEEGLRAILVDTTGLHGHSPTTMDRFGETVAVNRGAFAKVFENTDEAVAWIRERLAARDDAKDVRGP